MFINVPTVTPNVKMHVELGRYSLYVEAAAKKKTKKMYTLLVSFAKEIAPT